MSVFDWKIQYTGTATKTPELIYDCISASIHKSTEIKNNLCNLTLKNAPVKFAENVPLPTSRVGEYVDENTSLIKFDVNDEFQVWASFLTNATEFGTDWRDDPRSLGVFALQEFQVQTMENQSRIVVKAVDVAYLLFNVVYSQGYGSLAQLYTAPGIIRDCARKFGEANQVTLRFVYGTHHDANIKYAVDAKFVSEGGYIEDYRRIRKKTNPDEYTDDVSTTVSGSLSSSATTITVASTTGFDNSATGTVVIGTEHINYTGLTPTTFTGCTRGIDGTVAVSHSNGDTVHKGFPICYMSKIWKPLFEWIGELCQTSNTNYLSEIQEGGTLYFDRAFMFWVDEKNSTHFVYPDDEPDQTVTLGEEEYRNFNLTRNVFDAINFVIYNCGGDMYGNGTLWYWFDETSQVPDMKMRFQPMTKVINTLLDVDRKTFPRNTSTETDIYKQFPLTYPMIPTFMEEANMFRSEVGGKAGTAWAQVANDSEYNECLRDAARHRGLVESKKLTRNRSGLRYKGQITRKGTNVSPGDLLLVSNPLVGLSKKLRVIEVTHNMNQNSWETVMDVQEDERKVNDYGV